MNWSEIEEKIITKFDWFKYIDTQTPEGKKYLEENKLDIDDYKDYCDTVGGYIRIGYYDNSEKRVISILHEIAHNQVIINFNCPLMYLEMQMWQWAIKTAYVDFELTFSDDTISWAYVQVLSYSNYE